MQNRPADPIAAVQAAWGQACSAVGGLAQHLSAEFDRGAQQLHRASAQLAGELHSLSQRSPVQQPLFAALAQGSARRLPQAVAQLSSVPTDVKLRLQNIYVYTVANADQEFVLLSGEGGNRRLGLMFFAEADAHALVSKIKEDEPKLGKIVRVLKVPINEVYNFAAHPEAATGSADLIFRFMPDAAEIVSALELAKAEGLGDQPFKGVPLFQAESLCVRTPKARYTPLFFSKRDLDRAVANAFQQKENANETDAQKSFKGAGDELAAAKASLEETQGDAERQEAQIKVDAASSRLQKSDKHLSGVRNAALPKIEVGSLEEVITKMENDSSGDWNSVMFVPAGSVNMTPPA